MFNGLQLTNKGIELLTNLLNGHNIQFTHIKMGNGTRPADITTLTDLVSTKQTLEVARNSIVDQKTMLIGANLYGKLVTSSFYWTEIGLFAKDLDGDNIEYLFSYDNAGDEASYIPAGGAVTEQLIDLNVIVGNVENVVIEVDKSLLYATLEEMEKADNALKTVLETKINTDVKAVSDALTFHKDNIENPHQVTKSQVGLGSVQNYGVATTAEAKAGTSNAKYMTPIRVKEAIEGLGVASDGNVIIKIGSSQPAVQSGKTIIWINTGS
jgi:Holliday junction resolvasome RuvABC endonuclease subunit